MGNNYKCKTIEDWSFVAKNILSKYPDETLYAIYGPMGAGKTTLVQHLCTALKVKDTTTSPTYSIINEYRISTNKQPVYHMDFYRLIAYEEALDLGCEEIFHGNGFCFIEWPEIIETLLPIQYVQIRISKPEPDGQERYIQTNMV